jgi:beta-phosphoglucomutase
VPSGTQPQKANNNKNMTPKAFIFDMDGTMIDNMDVHVQAWEVTVEKLGGTLRGDALRKELYGKNEEVLERLFGNRFTMEERTAIGLQKEADYRELYAPFIQLIPGLEDFLHQAKTMGIPMAIGTASNRQNVDFVVSSLQLHRFINTIVGADDVSHGKPHPETYLKAALRLGVAPEDCLVFEDVPKGIETALNAGMRAMVVNSHHGETEFAAYDNIIGYINSFDNLHPATLATHLVK